MTRREKQVAITDLCAEILTAIRPGLNRNARYRDVGTGRRAQDEIMGDPAYYLETYFAADGSSRTLETTQGAATRVEHRFQVSLWLEYEDARTYEQSSQSSYDQLVEGAEGLLPQLRGTPAPGEPGHPNVDGWPAGLELGQPDPPSEPIVDLDNAGRLAHLCRFEIPLIHSTL
jgi:hypothetical protein